MPVDQIARLGLEVNSKDIEKAIKRLDQMEGKAGKAEYATGKLATSAAKNFAIATAGAVAFTTAVIAVTKSIIETSAEFEQYNIRLKAVLGSTEEGNRLFKDMVEFAGKVPFAFDEIMASATQLSGVMKGGVDEVNRWMPLIADLAAASGLSIQDTTGQVVRMYSAGAASADMFRERGILAMLGFQAGVSVSAEDTRDRLIAAWEDSNSKFNGAALDMADTWDGVMSMLGDKWTIFQTIVADEGLFDFFKSVASTINEELGGSMEDQQKLAKSLSDGIISYTKATAMGLAGVADAMAEPMSATLDVANSAWEGYQKLPDWVQDVGVLGAILGGRAGVMALGALSLLSDATGRVAKLAAAVSVDDLSLSDALMMNADEAKAFLDEIDGKRKDVSTPIPLFTEIDLESATGRVTAFFNTVEAKMANAGKDGAIIPSDNNQPKGGNNDTGSNITDLLEEEQQIKLGIMAMYFEQLHEMAAQSGMDQESLAIQAFDDELNRIEAHRDWLLEQGLLDADAQAEIDAARESAETTHLEKINGLQEGYVAKAVKIKSDWQKMMEAIDKGAYGDALQMAGVFADQLVALGGKSFEDNKVVQMAIAGIKGLGTIMNAIEHGSQTGGVYGAITEGAIATAMVGAQLMKINNASMGGSNGVSAPVGGSVPTSTPYNAGADTPTPQQPAQPSPIATTIIIQGNVIGNREFVTDTLLPILQDEIANNDVQIIEAGSRQALELAA